MLCLLKSVLQSIWLGKYGSIILTGLRASIGVTHSYSSHPFLCTLAPSDSWVLPNFSFPSDCGLCCSIQIWGSGMGHVHDVWQTNNPPLSRIVFSLEFVSLFCYSPAEVDNRRTTTDTTLDVWTASIRSCSFIHIQFWHSRLGQL